MDTAEEYLDPCKLNEYLDNIKSLISCFHTFGFRRTIDVLDSENQLGSGSVQIRTGSGAQGLTGEL